MIKGREEGMSGHLGRHRDGPDWKMVAHVGNWWRINLRRILRVIFKSLKLSSKAVEESQKAFGYRKDRQKEKIHMECFSQRGSFYSIKRLWLESSCSLQIPELGSIIHSALEPHFSCPGFSLN